MAGNITLNASSGTKPGARLTGWGKCSNSVTANAGATISPSDTISIGTLTIGGNLTLNGSTYEAQIAGGAEAFYDKLAVTGTLTLGGVLKLSKLSTIALNAGQVLQLFTAGTITGAFTSVQLPVLSAGLEWNTTELNTTGKISVQLSSGILNPQLPVGLLQNPCEGLFTVSMGAVNERLNLTVSDLQGRVVKTMVENPVNGYLQVNLIGLPDGVYMLRMEAEDKTAQMLKLIKKAYI
jgi:hypothetical protein